MSSENHEENGYGLDLDMLITLSYLQVKYPWRSAPYYLVHAVA
jgi:hypothetical protein